ncbi:MAG: 5-formyltetrahydrofolate cyclo-ligase [Alphaproteobacteria bacterium]|nr:5-formyltetrahydrofolate cyclo-ligase [Alphaproteobacteria bacterium]
MRRVRREAKASARGGGRALARRFLAGVRFAGIPLAKGLVAAAYYPIGSEADCRPLMLALHARGVRLALPVAMGPARPLAFRRWRPGQGLRAGVLGVPEPLGGGPVLPDLLIVPLLAFDARGFRLGQGGGYYDRTLAQLRRRKRIVAVGLAFAAQELDEVPADMHDAPLDVIVTERRVFRIRQVRA